MEVLRNEQNAQIYEFGPFLVDAARSALLRNGEVVPLGVKSFELLLFLIRHQGQELKKDEILRQVWPDTVVEENNLVRQISALRKALDEHPHEPQYILTIPGRGYRFLPNVREVEAVAVEAAGQISAKMNGQTQNGLHISAEPLALTTPQQPTFDAAKAMDAGISTVYVIPATESAMGGEWRQITEGRYFDDKPRWSPDGRALYFISNRTGFLNVWGVRFDPAAGESVGEPFRVTAFESPGQMILTDVRIMEMALAADRLILPIMEVSGGIWILENVQ